MPGHASWVDAYYPPGTKVAEMEKVPLYEWLLSHKRAASPSSNASVDASVPARSGGKRHGSGASHEEF